MRTIHKYPITITDEFIVQMPRAHKVIHIGEQRTFPQMWVEVDSEAELEDMTFYVVGTGNSIPPLALHLGTWQDGRFVWHLYEPMNQRLEIPD